MDSHSRSAQEEKFLSLEEMVHLMAAKSIKLVLQLVLQQNRQKAENCKSHQEADTKKNTELEIFSLLSKSFSGEPGRGDGVHSAAHLLKGGARLHR